MLISVSSKQADCLSLKAGLILKAKLNTINKAAYILNNIIKSSYWELIAPKHAKKRVIKSKVLFSAKKPKAKYNYNQKVL